MSIKLGLSKLKEIKAGTTANIVKVMRGATAVWEIVTEVVFSLQGFIDRVTADGGTYYPYAEEQLIDNGETLLMVPTATKAGKLYSAIPEDGSGDFTVANGVTPTISRVEVGSIDNKVTWSEDWTQYSGSSLVTVTSNTHVAPDGTMTADTINFTSTSGYIKKNALPAPATGDKYYLSVYVLNITTPVLTHGTNVSYYDEVFSYEAIGEGWYRHFYEWTYTFDSTTFTTPCSAQFTAST